MSDKARRLDPIAIYQSAIMNADGTINAGYVVLFKIIRVWLGLLALISVAGAIAFYAAWTLTEGRVDALIKILTWYGVAVGTVSAAIFVTALPGIAGFLWADSKNPSLRPGEAAPAGTLPGAAPSVGGTKP